MRFSELRLIKYGHFDSCRLPFPAGESDLHLVYGPNEAGKTTTLSAIRDLLFGFGHKTEQDYRFDRTLLRVGAVIETDSGELVVRRRKGDLRTLLDESDTPLADGTLTPLLHGYDADAFERMFSLDHARLRRGGGEIIAGQGDVGEAIFSAGAGLVGVARLRDELDAEAKGIWAKTAAQGRKYYVAKSMHDGARDRLKQAATKPARWETARREFERVADAVRERREAFARELAGQAAVERKRLLLLPVAQLEGKRAALAELGDVPALPADAAATCQACLTDIEAAKVRRETALGAARAARDALEGVNVPGELLRAAAAIERLRESKAAISDYVTDVPKRRATRDAELVRLRALQVELGWPAEGATEVRGRVPARTQHAGVRELVESRAGLDERLAAARRAHTQAEDEVTRLKRRAEALGNKVDVSRPSTAVRRIRASGDLDAAASRAARTAAQARHVAETALQALSPWRGSEEELRRLTVPGEQEVTERSDLLDRTTRAAELAEASLREAAERLAQRELELNQALETGAPILPEVVVEARASRDSLWSMLRGGLLGETHLEDVAGSVGVYEGRVGSADNLSDRRTEASQATALAIARRQNRDTARLSLEQVEQRRDEAVRLREEALLPWQQAMRPIGADLSVSAFRTWRSLAQRAIELAGEANEREADRDEAQSDVLEALEEARGLASDLGVDGNGLPLAGLLGQLEAKLEAVANANAERRSVDERIEAAEAAAAGHKRDLDAAEAALQEWTSSWTDRVAAANLGEEANLSLVRARLDLLDEVRSVAERIVDLERRIASMEEAVAGFGAKIEEAALQSGVALAPAEEPLSRLDALSAALAEASALEQERAALARRLEEAETSAEAAASEIRTAEAMLRPLMEMAAAADAPGLMMVIDRSAAARTLRQEIATLEDQVLAAGGGGSLQELIDLVQAADPAQLEAESKRIAQALADLQTELQGLSEEKQLHESAFRAIDDGPDAAIAAAELAQGRSEMEFQAETYIQRRTEAVLLRWAMERFRRERQAPLLEAASSIFSRLTLGRYSALDVEVEGNKGQLIGVRSDGSTTVPAPRMSDGTADQLYLALRIAAVREAVAAGARLPFVADDLFINYDDERAAAGFKELAELGSVTQVLFLTHHEHLLEIARTAVAPLQVSSCTLGSDRTAKPDALAAAHQGQAERSGGAKEDPQPRGYLDP